MAKLIASPMVVYDRVPFVRDDTLGSGPSEKHQAYGASQGARAIMHDSRVVRAKCWQGNAAQMNETRRLGSLVILREPADRDMTKPEAARSTFFGFRIPTKSRCR